MANTSTDIAIIGTGIVGIATAYYAAKNHGLSDIILIDRDQPMAFTSAQSGENYRNWWSHPLMVDFTNRSIDLLEAIARESGNRINMTRRGYALATRAGNIDELIAQLHTGLDDRAEKLLRFHDAAEPLTYQPPLKADWQNALDGVDILQNQNLIKKTFPSYSSEVRTVIHIRRGGDISGQQLGAHMLSYLKDSGARRIVGAVTSIEKATAYRLALQTTQGVVEVRADKIVNAAGPFADSIAKMLDVRLPIYNTLQQKIAFEDRQPVIPRNMPFSIDLDSQHIDWSNEERELLLEDPDFRWLADEMPGAIHCRPDGGDRGTWVKLGWAYNRTPVSATWKPPLDDHFPDIVLRGAARLNPGLKAYYGQLPRNRHHYGGWYTMTAENWPLIGPMGPEGAYMNCAFSGFGTMAACVGGELCASWIAEAERAPYANAFSLGRYQDATLMNILRDSNKGVL